MADVKPTMKRCKVYPRNGKQFIPGILNKRKRIEFPAELPLTLAEVKRCIMFADVYEMPEGKGSEKCVYLNAQNWMKDNSKAEAATDVPKDKLLYPRDEEEDAADTTEDPGQEKQQIDEHDDQKAEDAADDTPVAPQSTTPNKTASVNIKQAQYQNKNKNNK